MRDLATPRPTFVLARGAYDAPTERGHAGHAGTRSATCRRRSPQNRLGLARWLRRSGASAHRARRWSIATGRGCSAGASSRRRRTSAARAGCRRIPRCSTGWRRLRRSGWDLKALQKRMVMSATYRQSSRRRRRSTLSADPENEWLARGPSYRLSAEQIRDSALASSGLLVDDDRRAERLSLPAARPVGGAGDAQRDELRAGQGRRAAPPQPVHLLEAHRRRRRRRPASTPPSGCSARVSRQRTNTPLQALVLLNDPQFVEAARALAERHADGGRRRRRASGSRFGVPAGRRPAPRPEELAAAASSSIATSTRASPRTRRRRRSCSSVGEHPRNRALDAADWRRLHGGREHAPELRRGGHEAMKLVGPLSLAASRWHERRVMRSSMI